MLQCWQDDSTSESPDDMIKQSHKELFQYHGTCQSCSLTITKNPDQYYKICNFEVEAYVDTNRNLKVFKCHITPVYYMYINSRAAYLGTIFFVLRATYITATLPHFMAQKLLLYPWLHKHQVIGMQENSKCITKIHSKNIYIIHVYQINSTSFVNITYIII